MLKKFNSHSLTLQKMFWQLYSVAKANQFQSRDFWCGSWTSCTQAKSYLLQRPIQKSGLSARTLFLTLLSKLYPMTGHTQITVPYSYKYLVTTYVLHQQNITQAITN